MRSALVCLSLAAAVGLSGCGSVSNPEAEAAALAAAISWLSLVDNGEYAESTGHPCPARRTGNTS
jgi:hypothetical protein